MRGVLLYHNPRCRKSREGLVLLQDRGIEPQIIKYLDTPPDEQILRELGNKMGLRPKDFIRKEEKLFRELELKQSLEDDNVLYKAMAEHPKLIQRPIAVAGGKAALGRPPENVLNVL